MWGGNMEELLPLPKRRRALIYLGKAYGRIAAEEQRYGLVFWIDKLVPLTPLVAKKLKSKINIMNNVKFFQIVSDIMNYLN